MQDEKKPEKATAGTIAALVFVAIVWGLATLAGLSRARAVGWPACLTDQGVVAMLGISLGLLAIVVVNRGEIIRASILACPKCGSNATRGGFHTWQFIVAILFFPLGLLALLAGRGPNKCQSCGDV